MAGCSSTVGKAWARDRIIELAPASIVDVGAGRGAYRDLIGDSIDAFWIAVDVFEPYVSKYKLRDRYDQVIISDAIWMDWSLLGDVDLAICGDVLEHMTHKEALTVWESIRSISKHVLLSIPVGEWPQGPSHGNVFETHISTWTTDECLALPGVYDHKVYSKIGVFLARGAA